MNKNKINISAFILGLTSMVGQIIIIRELIVVFYGNELSLGIILASWLFWISVGSGIFGRLVDKIKYKEKLLSNIQLITAVILPLTIFLIRNIKSILRISPGELMGFIPIFTSSFLSLSIIGMLLGFTFTLISKISSKGSKTPAKEVGKIYLLEGVGASIGGLIYSFFLIKTLSPFQNVFIVGGVNLFASLLINKNIYHFLYLTILSASFIFNWPQSLEQYTRKLQFKPFTVLESIDSIYGNITVTKTGKEFSFYENGVLLFTSGDLLTSEESVHYAMLEHPNPKRVLLIGGGVGGALKEILKHPVEKVDYVELDPLIISLGEKYLGPIKDKRVTTILMDGRMFIRVKSPLAKNYDVIILNLPDPYTAMLNRFYSLEFFREAKKRLSPSGILSFSLSSSENYLSHEQIMYLGSIYKTLEKEFKDIKIFPGDTATFFASNRLNTLTYDSDILINRLNERNIDTKFVREYYLPFKLNSLRVKYIEDSVTKSSTAKINQDFKPIGYLYYMSLWLSLFHGGKGILPFIQNINIGFFIWIILALFAIVFLVQKIKKLSLKTIVSLSVGTTGMSEIAFQIIVILSFQFLYGYMYYKIGVILTSFMIGLVLGSFCINKLLQKIKDTKSLYIKTQISICLYPLILALILILIAKINIVKPNISNSLQASFAFLPIIAGFIGGFQFPLANKICLKGSQDIGKTTGLLYGIDLLGACIGGLLVGIIFVPLLGIIQTCLLLAIINSLVLLLIFQKNMV